MLTRQTVELLIDLVENKLGSMEILDRDDRRAIRELEACLSELSALTRRAMDRGAKTLAP